MSDERTPTAEPDPDTVRVTGRCQHCGERLSKEDGRWVHTGTGMVACAL